MIKRIGSVILSVIIFAACNNDPKPENGSSAKETEDVSSSERGRKITARNYSINKDNAYNNIFLDSLTLTKFIQTNNVPDSLSRRIISFYNSRNYQYAWFSAEGLTEQARGFWNLQNYHGDQPADSIDKQLSQAMDNFLGDDDLIVSTGDKSILDIEFKLTQHFILYALNNIESGYVKRKELERFIPAKKEDAVALADSLLGKKHKNNKYYEDINKAYKLLKEQLKIYVDVSKKGGWPAVTGDPKQIKKGTSSGAVATIKKRLYLTGDLATLDSSQLFDEQLAAGIQHFQLRHGYTGDGILTTALLKDMNVPVLERIQQILINMGRMQWMTDEPSGELIVVNIPEFILHYKDGPKKVFDMDVVVGKEGHNTTIFTGNLNQVVFSPYWNVPSSIVKKEIVPAMKRNKNYLKNNEMEITGHNGGLPVVRQLPGSKNSLGRVKFLFPNSFDIYFHDTPAKGLFEKDKRAYSHGCIRLSDPVKMANYLLRNDPSWDSTKIETAMNTGKEQYVKLKKTVLVLITYYTAWVDDEGLLHFADDIYARDKIIAQKMFANT